MDLLTIAKDYGLFVALVVFIIWDNRQREKNFQERELRLAEDSRVRQEMYAEETRKREQKYIEREERYIDREEKYIRVIEGLSDSYEHIQRDVTYIKDRMNI